jgi:tagatose 1,6-diphosphate aldolase
MAKISKMKLERLEKIAGSDGVISAAAMDQRGSLQRALGEAMGKEKSAVTAQQMTEFKTAVSKVLTPYASAILLDPVYGLEGVKAKDPKAGLLLAYEKTGYDNTQPGRLSQLIPDRSVRRQVADGAQAIKLLLYYASDEDQAINEMKHAWIERIGAECAANEIPLFLESVCYDTKGGSGKDAEFAKRKPHLVLDIMKEFSKPQYNVDVLKVEFPFNPAFVKGTKANKTGEVAYDKSQALDYVKQQADATNLPFIYLSAGVDDDVFRESLEICGDANISFAGVLCGRATWKDGIPVYAKDGVKALEDWLSDRGVQNIQALNKTLQQVAKPWFDKCGGRDKVEVVERTEV